MASFQNALICAVLATMLWTCIGLSLSLRVLPRSLALPVAPALGWAVCNVIALPLFCVVGMARPTVIAVFFLSLAAALGSLWRLPPSDADADRGHGRVPWWAMAGAALLASAVMAMLLPRITADGVTLAAAIFDHAKVAMIDEMARLGVPAGNPFFGESDGLNRLSYYYLWHFSAAALSVLTGLTGWETDAGLTGFTAFSTLMLMMGLAQWLSGRASSAGWVLILAAGFAIRPVLSMTFGEVNTNEITGWPSGFGGWLFQSTWAPQHVASDGCVVIAIFLLIELASRQRLLTAIVFSLMAAAAFQSSTWVGGVTLPLAAASVGTLLLLRIEPTARWRWIICAAGAAALALAIVSPFLYDQFRASALRAEGPPIGIQPYDVLGDRTPASIRKFLDVPAYWTTLLFTEFAAFYPAGFLMMAWLVKDRQLPQTQKFFVQPLGLLAFISLAVGSMLISKLGSNNDLAWRGVGPAIFILVVFTAAGFSLYLKTLPRGLAVAMVGFAALSFVLGVRAIYSNTLVSSNKPSSTFADSARMWRAVRKNSGESERVANNPRFFGGMTPWPINISWALMGNRRSCYAGPDYGPFAPRTRLPKADIALQFGRVFSGQPEAGDLDQLANEYYCAIVVVTPQDGAWRNDPFASSPLYRLVETEPENWRIYRAQTSGKK